MKTLDLRELEKLGRLQLNIRRSLSQGEGARRSSAKGRSAEFSGYREYIPGDDMRYVDWNAYGRLDKLYIKEYMEEREGRVNIYLDTSASMEYGEKLKSTLMAELTEAISYVAMKGRDAVYVTDLGDIANTIRVPGGTQGTAVLKKWLESIKPKNRIDLVASLKRAVRGKGGIAFVISDFMDENFLAGEEQLLRLFGYHSMQVVMLHVLSKEELEIDDIGAYEFIDIEEETKNLRLTLDRQTVDDYQKALDDYIRDIQSKVELVGGFYFLCSTEEPISQIMFEKLRPIYTI